MIEEHLTSLRWTGKEISTPVIMIDDVFTLGRTSDACRLILSASGAGPVVVACLAKTQR